MASIEKRTLKDGTTKYRVKVRLKGYPTQTATFQRITDAKKWVQHTEAAIREGRHFKTAEAKKHTFVELADRYIKEVLPTKPKSAAKQKAQLTWWSNELGGYLLSDVTPALISEAKTKLLHGETYRHTPRKPQTVNRYLAVLSHCFTYAVKEWGWMDDSPTRKVKKYTEARGRVRFLSDDERERLLMVCKKSTDPLLYPIVVLAIATGMRHGEIVNLNWKDVDLGGGFVTLHDTKNSERRRVPVTGFALETLKKYSRVRRLETDLVFPRETKVRGETVYKPYVARYAWLRALERAEIEDFTFHDLRHTAASYLAMNGATLAEIAEILGHKTLAMVQRYAHLSEGHTKKVVQSMNSKIFRQGS